MSKANRKKKDHVINIEDARYQRTRSKHVDLIPRNSAQEEYMACLANPSIRAVFAVGPAGTGKTMIAVKFAIKALLNGEIERIVVTRPAVSVDEKHGFLPGDLNAKMEPWTRPIFDVFEEHFNPKEIAAMMADGVIEIAPLGFMRGRTFKNSYIIADETQNCTVDQMKMLLTRIGEGSHIAVTGDLKQHDRGFATNGLKDFTERLANRNTPGLAVCTFGREHVERDPIVATVLEIYGDL